jgi:hypothetical protein
MLIEFDCILGFFDLEVIQGVRTRNTSLGYDRPDYVVEFLVSGKWSKVHGCMSDGKKADQIVDRVVQRVNEKKITAKPKPLDKLYQVEK